MMKLSWVLATVSLCTLSAVATAQVPKAKPIKAEFLCGTMADGKIVKPITGGKIAKLTDTVACAMHVADPNEPSHMGNIHTIRYTADKKKIDTSGKTDDFGKDSAPGKADFEMLIKPNEPDENGEVLIKTCEDFDIVASISDDRGVYFKKTIKVTQSCPKPKPIAATVECNQFFPGGGGLTINDKKHERSNTETIECVVSSKDPRIDDTSLKLVGTSKWEHYADDQSHKTTTKEIAGSHGNKGKLSFSFDPSIWDNCLPASMQFDVRDADGNVLYTHVLKTTLTCGE